MTRTHEDGRGTPEGESRPIEAGTAGKAVLASLKNLKSQAKDKDINLMPAIYECVESDATLQEICDVLREVFGEAQPMKL